MSTDVLFTVFPLSHCRLLERKKESTTARQSKQWRWQSNFVLRALEERRVHSAGPSLASAVSEKRALLSELGECEAESPLGVLKCATVAQT